MGRRAAYASTLERSVTKVTVLSERRGIVADLAWMGGSTTLRLGSGLLLFVVLARVLGLENFGVVVTWFAVGALVALPTNFGLTPFLLREGSRAPDGGNEILGRAIGLKLVLLAITSFGLLLAGSLYPGAKLLLWPLFLTHATESFTELICARLRVAGAFSRETRNVTVQSLMYLVVVSAAALVWTDPIAVAFAFFVSRIVGLLLAARTLFLVIGAWPRPVFSKMANIVKMAKAYFVDYGLQASLVQVDVVLLNAYAGTVAVGLYQAGMRIAHGLSQTISILVNVVLPRLSRSTRGPLPTSGAMTKVTLLFGMAGVVLGGGLFLASDFIAARVFGEGFLLVGPVLNILAFFLAIRFLGAAAGVLLIVSGRQGARAASSAAGLLVLCGVGAPLMSEQGAPGAAIAMCWAYACIAAMQWIVVMKARQKAV